MGSGKYGWGKIGRRGGVTGAGSSDGGGGIARQEVTGTGKGEGGTHFMHSRS